MNEQNNPNHLLTETEHQRYEDMLTNEEKRVVAIVEERGVYGFKWSKTVDGICDYLNRCLFINTPLDNKTFSLGDFQCQSTEFSITVPPSVTKGIDIFEELTIVADIHNLLTISSIEDSLYGQGSGRYSIKRYERLTNGGKLPATTIYIDGYAVNGKIVPHTIMTSLYHELNHAADNYSRLKKYGNRGLYDEFEKMDVDTVYHLMNSDYPIDASVGFILYRLFITSERNALITSVYSDLKSMKSLRSNFVRDIRNTKAYKVYNLIKDKHLPILNKITDEEAKRYANELSLPFSVLGRKPFMDAFKKKTMFLIGDLLKRIGKTATLYYDENEEKRDNNNPVRKKYKVNSYDI